MTARPVAVSASKSISEVLRGSDLRGPRLGLGQTASKRRSIRTSFGQAAASERKKANKVARRVHELLQAHERLKRTGLDELMRIAKGKGKDLDGDESLRRAARAGTLQERADVRALLSDSALAEEVRKMQEEKRLEWLERTGIRRAASRAGTQIASAEAKSFADRVERFIKADRILYPVSGLCAELRRLTPSQLLALAAAGKLQGRRDVQTLLLDSNVADYVVTHPNL